MSDQPRSHGRKSITASLKPRGLMDHNPRLAGVWTAHIITLFPEAFPGVLGESLTGRALKDRLWTLETTALREFGEGRHRNVDDTPAGGGAGMVMRADVMSRAIDAATAVGVASVATHYAYLLGHYPHGHHRDGLHGLCPE